VLQAIASEGLAQGPYVTARVGFKPATLWTQGTEPTTEPPCSKIIYININSVKKLCQIFLLMDDILARLNTQTKRIRHLFKYMMGKNKQKLGKTQDKGPENSSFTNATLHQHEVFTL